MGLERMAQLVRPAKPTLAPKAKPPAAKPKPAVPQRLYSLRARAGAAPAALHDSHAAPTQRVSEPMQSMHTLSGWQATSLRSSADQQSVCGQCVHMLKAYKGGQLNVEQ